MNKNTKDFLILQDKIKKLNSHKLFETSINFSEKEFRRFFC